MLRDSASLLAHLRRIHHALRDHLVAHLENAALEQVSAAVDHDQAGDTVFELDRISEAVLLEHFAALAQTWPCLLVAEGLGQSGQAALPAGLDPRDAEIVIIVDPIDGTRGLMYQKRPAWILTGVAPYRGQLPTLAGIELALQTEVPLVKQHLCDSLWAVAEPGAALGPAVVGGERLDRTTGQRWPLRPRPSRAATIEQGFGGLARFFPGPRALLAAIDDALVARLLGPAPAGRALAFEDQYISTGGQLYELMLGHDRWVADLRPLIWAARGQRGLCCHPYDLCTELIARAAGVRVTDPAGGPLTAPLDAHTDVAWVACANDALYAQVMPTLQQLLREHGLA